jgi:hypothetical protein
MSGKFDPPSALMSSAEAQAWYESVRVRPADAVCPAGCPAEAHQPGVGVRDCICWWLEPCRACDAIIAVDRAGLIP